MRIKRGTKWYLFPKDAHTNEVISSALDGLNSVEKYSSLECQDGVRRNLCEVPDYNFVARLWRSRYPALLVFEIFRSQDDLRPGPWLFPEPKRLTQEQLVLKRVLRSENLGPGNKRKATQF